MAIMTVHLCCDVSNLGGSLAQFKVHELNNSTVLVQALACPHANPVILEKV
jgi:hypothetical protein